jgi:hypothetical protein
MVFENRVLRRIFGRMRVDVIGGWRGPHNNEVHNFYPLSCISRMIETRMRCSTNGGEKECI